VTWRAPRQPTIGLVLGVVGGHSLLASDDGTSFAGGARRRLAHGPGGPVTILDAGNHVVLQRHGLDDYVPAHLVDHARNVGALAAVGCDRVLALSSVGGLRPELAVGTHLVPDDFVALDRPGISVYSDARCHVVPGFTPAWRAQVLEGWRRSGAIDAASIVDGGVYWQANGPRFETPAEIRVIRGFADVVGMTIGSECTAANELGLEYAAVCIVDNLANGVGDHVLTREEFETGKRANHERLAAVLTDVVAALA
jgi:5'-methylthioadenosine phosphorylase